MKIILMFILASTWAFSFENDPCVGLVNLELNKNGYGTIDKPSLCLNKGKGISTEGELIVLSISNVENPNKVSYDSRERKLDIIRGEDPITGQKEIYSYKYSKDSECSMISTINLSSMAGVDINESFCKQFLDPATVNNKFSKEEKFKLRKICIEYGARFEPRNVYGKQSMNREILPSVPGLK